MSRTLKVNRREFVAATAAAGVGFWISGTAAAPSVSDRGRGKEKLNLACIGVGGRGYSNLTQVGNHENIIAICDVDKERAKKAIAAYVDKRQAKFYTDYRDLIEAHHKELDGIVVATPDHMHAPIATLAMSLGLHCYCEKPLSWGIEESRVLSAMANKQGLVTQMGNQGTGTIGFRVGVEALWEGIIGDVRQVHVWTNRPVWPQAVLRPTEKKSVPKTLDWKGFLGCAKHRPYHPDYTPFNWRGWYDYGTGALGDMACHTANLAYMGLKLGLPSKVTAKTTPLFPETYPAGSYLEYDFPEREGMPPVTIYWYDGENRPPADILDGEEIPQAGCVLIGEKGKMFLPDDYNSKQILLPKEKFPERLNPKRVLPRTAGHHLEWLNAIKKGGETLSNFDHAARFTEAVMIGNLAIRMGKTIEWDAENMQAIGLPEADALIKRTYENGYDLVRP